VTLQCALTLGFAAGVWEFITSKEAIDLIGDCETPEEACRVVSAVTALAALFAVQHRYAGLLLHYHHHCPCCCAALLLDMYVDHVWARALPHQLQGT
jgi:hypothetical protein